jgi:soluble lytic murein transglycosylase-like protein
MDPDFSIHAGTKLLAQLQQKYDGDEELALFGYARGIGRVADWQQTPGQPLPEGVQTFIAKVRRAQATFAKLGFPEEALQRR